MKVLILEDETLAADKLESTLLEIQPEIQVICRIKSISSAVEWLRANPHPDLIISDIRLLDGLCFEIFSQVKVEKPVIFTTAYDQYAIRAFEVNSIDYLLKPVQKEKLQAALAKLQVPRTPPFPDYNEVLNFIKANKTSYKSRFMVRLGQRIIAVPSEKIAYFYSENKLTYIVTLDNKKFPMDQPLDEVIDLLDPKRFFRANRQFIVAFDSIAEIHPYFKGRIKIVLQPRSDEEVVISSDRTPEFKKWIDQ
jgi:DNA-binding LytR/AlgR family response regulator